MTHSSNALQINETYESIKFYIPKILTATRTLKTKLTTIEAAATTTAIVETPVTATTIITNYNNVTNLLKRDLSNSTNNVGNSGKQDNDIYNDFNYNNDCMKLNQNYHESVDNEVEHAFKLSSPALGLKKIEIEATTASIAGKKAVTPTIAITTKTTKTKKTESCHHNKKAASQINSASISSKSSGNSEGYTSTNFNALDNDNDYDNDNVNVNEINDKCENDIYSNDSLESLSLDTYSSTSTTAEVADTTITTNTTLILESCCSKKSLPPNERVEDTNALKEDGKKRNTKLDNNSVREGAMSCSSSASSTSSTSFSTNVAVDNAAVTTVSASSKYQNITNKSPMYIIKIQTIQLKQTLASAHKRKAQNKNRKKSIANPSTSTSTSTSSKGLKRAQTSVQPSLSSAINHTTTKTTTTTTTAAATTTTTTTIIGVVNGDSAELGDGNDPSDKAMDVAGNNKNKLRQLCPMPYQSNALNEKQLSSFGMANVHKRTLSSSSYRSGISHYSVHTVNSATLSAKASCKFWNCLRWLCIWLKNSGIGEPSVHHALVVIFLEFFAWGLLTMPVIAVLNQTFPDHTFLMNGLVMGIKGILSFLSAPLIGALSDIWGRKFFLLITVFFTCAPIPLMTINTWWFFAMISISGIFAVTFSVVFAYVADVTTVEGRSKAYGLVSATFAASLVISPALGAALMEKYSDTLVVALATAIAVLDVFFILVAVPESLPDKVRPSSWGAPINWEQADPFAALRKVGSDHTILMQCVTVLLSYLPEAGQYSCIFVYLKLKMSFNTMEVAIFIAVVGILSISVQVTLGYLMRKVGAKQTIILGLILEMTQLFWYGFGSQKWMMWAAGILAALGSVTYPAISAFVSIHSTADSQGAVQGMVTGMRGLCNGLGPAMFGIIFYLFNVDLNDEHALIENAMIHAVSGNASSSSGGNNGSAGGGSGGGGGTGAGGGGGGIGKWLQMPGPPFIFGGFMVILAILVALFIPEYHNEFNFKGSPIEKKRISLDVQYEIECGPTSTSPLMHSDSLAQL